MSTIMKKPLIETIMDNLDGDTLVKLHSDIDSDTGYSEYNLLERYLPQLGEGEQSLAVRATLITNGETLVGSYIKYSSLGETHSYLLNYGRGVHKVYIYEINEEKKTTYLVGECLGVSELRRVIVDRLIEQGANDIPIHKNENGSYVFNEGLEVKSNGDVTVGKNLEVAGKVFTLNGKQWGIMPVKSVDDNGNYSDMGFILSNILPHTNEDNRINVSGIWFNIANNYIKFCMSKNKYLIPGYTETHIEDGVLYISTHEIYKIEELFTAFLSSDYVSRTYQAKLFRHNLVLNGKYWKEYITDNNLKVDSIQDLDTITHAKNGTTLVLGAENQLLLIKQGDTWKIGAETVTTVSDNVTTL